MEASVTELGNGQLLMSLRTQLGGPFISRSDDGGATWSEPIFSDLEGGESCTCLRRIPGTNDVVLFWNHSKYETQHHHYGERSPLTAAMSSDNGESWKILGNIAEDPNAEYTNLDCFFTSKGAAVLTYMRARPAWNREQISLKAALIPRTWFSKERRF
jgi:sialidase-1